MDHPIAFHKSADLGKVPRKLAAAALPDLEEAFDVCRCFSDMARLFDDIFLAA
jgi:hypothetical protein